jgi:hypothetical protein
MAGGKDDLWRDFPKTAIEFERRFVTEEAYRAYWIEARWAVSRRAPAAAASACGLSVVASYLSAPTATSRKPFKVRLSACSRSPPNATASRPRSCSGSGSYKRAWSWLHKLRAALVRQEREPLYQAVQIDELWSGASARESRWCSSGGCARTSR